MTGSGISEAEWEVMRVLWSLESGTAREVIERLNPKKDWHPRTVKTLLGRLVSKGVLRTEAEGNRYRYFPLISRADAVEAEGRSLQQRVFGGRVAPMLAHFVQRADLSRDEIDDLRRLLDEKAD